MRRADIDFFKGIAIISVVLYHVGLLPYGYLAVDTFFVINGFLIIPHLVKSISSDTFSFIPWFSKRILRFLPVILLAVVVCLLLGYICMIPGDYENLAQSVFASGIFCNNILSAITTGNYWDSVNEYKPLMHLWYLGIVVQFYFIFPLLLVIIKKLCNRADVKSLFIGIVVLCIISLVLYLCPNFSFNSKFYYLPFRIWEFCIGGIVGLLLINGKWNNLQLSPAVTCVVLLLLISCFCFNFKSFSSLDTITIIGSDSISTQVLPLINIPKELFLIITVLLSAVLMLKKKAWPDGNYFFKSIAFFGKMSLSIFVWHQIMLAFMRYSLIDTITLSAFVCFVIALSVVSYISYKWVESIRLESKISRGLVVTCWVVVLAVAFLIHYRAGVVRDVPELDITVENPYVNRNTEYIDRIYDYDKPFSSANKIKVLVVGNSFARDFACCLLEWDKDHILDLSYMFSFSENIDERYAECDYLFCFAPKYNVPKDVWDAIKPDCQVYGIGTKSFGHSFGRIYARRFKSDYYATTVPIHPMCEKVNNEYKNSWGADHYIDFMEAVKEGDGRIRVFTDDNKVISFDCRHLTQNGAKYYAKKLDFDRIFKIN